mgnify:CR=1 FL=1
MIAEGQAELRKDNKLANQKRRSMYTKEKLLPSEIINEVPYRKTYEALKEDKFDELKSLFLNSYSRNIVQSVYRRF